MIQTVLNGMITLMMAKFVVNDMTHAAGFTENNSSALFNISYDTERETVPEGEREWGEATFRLGEEAIGRALFTFYMGGEGEIAEMEIYPEFRGKGYGLRAYSELESRARKLGVKKITGFVQPGVLGPYEDAKRFWESAGFTVYPTQEMEKVL